MARVFQSACFLKCTYVRCFDTTVSIAQPLKLTEKCAVGQNTMSRDLACNSAVLHAVVVASFACFIRKGSYSIITFTTCQIYIQLCTNTMLLEATCFYRPPN